MSLSLLGFVGFFNTTVLEVLLQFLSCRKKPTSSFSSFLTCFRLALRSMDTLCLEPSRAASMASADIRTFLRAGFLKYLPFRS